MHLVPGQRVVIHGMSPVHGHEVRCAGSGALTEAPTIGRIEVVPHLGEKNELERCRRPVRRHGSLAKLDIGRNGLSRRCKTRAQRGPWRGPRRCGGRGLRSGHRWSTPARRRSSSGLRGGRPASRLAFGPHRAENGSPRGPARRCRGGRSRGLAESWSQKHLKIPRESAHGMGAENGLGPRELRCKALHGLSLAAGNGISELDPARLLPRKLARLSPMPGPGPAARGGVPQLRHMPRVRPRPLRRGRDDHRGPTVRAQGHRTREAGPTEPRRRAHARGHRGDRVRRRDTASFRASPRLTLIPRDESRAAPRLVKDCWPRRL